MIVGPLDLALVPRVVLPGLPIERVGAPGVEAVVEPLAVVAHIPVVPLIRPIVAAAPAALMTVGPAAVAATTSAAAAVGYSGPFSLHLLVGGASLDPPV